MHTNPCLPALKQDNSGNIKQKTNAKT